MDKISKLRDTKIEKEFVNVFLVDKPGTTVFANLYQDYKATKIKYDYCSTIECAIKRLALKKNKNEITYILENLKMHFKTNHY